MGPRAEAYRTIRDVYQARDPSIPLNLLGANRLLAQGLIDLGRYEEAERLLEDVNGLLRQLDVRQCNVRVTVRKLLRLYAETDQPEKATRLVKPLVAKLLDDIDTEFLRQYAYMIVTQRGLEPDCYDQAPAMVEKARSPAPDDLDIRLVRRKVSGRCRLTYLARAESASGDRDAAVSILTQLMRVIEQKRARLTIYDTWLDEVQRATRRSNLPVGVNP